MSTTSPHITIGGISTTIEVVTYLAQKWAEHQAKEQGITVEAALSQAAANYAAAQTENNDLKQEGHS